MLRQVGSRDAETLLQLRRPPLALGQHVDQVQTSRVSKSFAEYRLALIALLAVVQFLLHTKFLGQHVGIAAALRRPSPSRIAEWSLRGATADQPCKPAML